MKKFLSRLIVPVFLLFPNPVLVLAVSVPMSASANASVRESDNEEWLDENESGALGDLSEEQAGSYDDGQEQAPHTDDQPNIYDPYALKPSEETSLDDEIKAEQPAGGNFYADSDDVSDDLYEENEEEFYGEDDEELYEEDEEEFDDDYGDDEDDLTDDSDDEDEVEELY